MFEQVILILEQFRKAAVVDPIQAGAGRHKKIVRTDYFLRRHFDHNMQATRRCDALSAWSNLRDVRRGLIDEAGDSRRQRDPDCVGGLLQRGNRCLGDIVFLDSDFLQ